MARVIAVANQKGGVGKTTSVINIGIGLVKEGKRVLLIDFDTQGSMTNALGIKASSLRNTVTQIMDLILDGKPMEHVKNYIEDKVVLQHEEGVEFIPSNTVLAGMESSLLDEQPGIRNYILKKVVEAYRDQYDYILIDCQPSLGILTLNAFCAADSVIVPVQAQYLALEGFGELLKTVRRVHKKLNPDLDIEGILMTMTNHRTNMYRRIAQTLQEEYGEQLTIYKETIPYTVRLGETAEQGVSIYRHDRRGKAAAAYQEVVKEVLDYGNERS